jgi:hypothetical protein
LTPRILGLAGFRVVEVISGGEASDSLLEVRVDDFQRWNDWERSS